MQDARPHWLARCEEVGIPAGPIYSVPEALADPQAVARGMVEEYDYPGAGRVKALGNPVKLSRSPARLAKGAPRLGEDNAGGAGRARSRRRRDRAAWRRRAVTGRRCADETFVEGGRGGDDPVCPRRAPRVHPGAYVDPAAQVIGDVTIDEGASVWPFSVLRGDQDNYVTLGRNSNVQDGSVLHVTPEFPCIVGAGVTIGHRSSSTPAP